MNLKHLRRLTIRNLLSQFGILVVLTLFTHLLYAEEQPSMLDTIEGKGEAPTGEILEYFEKAKGYLSVPEGEGPFGAVILIHEWNGLVERVKQVADSLAKTGYIALAADLYSGRIGTNREENIALVREVRADEQTLIDNLNAAVNYLKSRSDSNGTVATIGWCFGGGVALTFGMGGEEHDGTAIFYGQLLDDPEKLASIHHEIHGTFAGQDRNPTVEQVESFVEALRKAGIPNDIHVYDPVQHGFWLYVERDLETNQEPAEHAWGRLQDFLQRVLKSEENEGNE